MAALSEAKRVPRGAAALEFAIVAPMLLLLLTGVIYFALALMTKYSLHGLAVAATRNCVAMQATGTSEATLKSCATEQFSFLRAQTGMAGGCSGTPQATSNTTPLSLRQAGRSSGQKMVLLTLDVSCSFNVNPLSVFSGMAGNSSMPDTINLTATSAMPFAIKN